MLGRFLLTFGAVLLAVAPNLAKPLTNAERLQRGLAPKTPSRLYSPSRTTAKRATTSFVPTSCAGFGEDSTFLIRVDYASGGTLGYIPDYNGNFVVSYPDPNINNAGCFASSTGSTTGTFGILQNLGSGGEYWVLYAPDSGNSNWSPSNPSPEGSEGLLYVQSNGINDDSRGEETTVWSVVGSDGQLQTQWTGRDGTVYNPGPNLYADPSTGTIGAGFVNPGGLAQVYLYVVPIVPS